MMKFELISIKQLVGSRPKAAQQHAEQHVAEATEQLRQRNSPTRQSRLWRR